MARCPVGERNKIKTTAARELRICFCSRPAILRAIKLCQFVLAVFGYVSIDKHSVHLGSHLPRTPA